MDIVIHFLKFRENPKEKGKLDVVYGQYFPQLQDYDTQEKVANFDSLMAMIKTKIQETDDARTKIHLLTLAPNSWPISKLQEYFQVRLKVELIHNI